MEQQRWLRWIESAANRRSVSTCGRRRLISKLRHLLGRCRTRSVGSARRLRHGCALRGTDRSSASACPDTQSTEFPANAQRAVRPQHTLMRATPGRHTKLDTSTPSEYVDQANQNKTKVCKESRLPRGLSVPENWRKTTM